jgi:succinate dehydrogenase hydrophobic anchor subunit
MPFYLNLFFINILNICVLALFMISGVLLSFLRFKAIIEDYIPNSHKRMVLKILFIALNIFLFTFTFFTFIYFNFVISITTL